MPHTLYLLRHGKAEQGHGLPDHERGLSARGRTDVAARSALLDPLPDLVRCSSAVRATQTLELLALSEGTDVWVEDDLYATDARGLLTLLTETPDDVQTLLVIGHNPALSDATVLLARREDRRTAEQGLRSSVVAVLTFDGSWSDLRPGTARLTDLVG